MKLLRWLLTMFFGKPTLTSPGVCDTCEAPMYWCNCAEGCTLLLCPTPNCQGDIRHD